MSLILGASIVCFSSNAAELRSTLLSLLRACAQAQADGLLTSTRIVLIDNGPALSEREKILGLVAECRRLTPSAIDLAVIGDGTNIGFGAGHNLAFALTACDFYLVLNPDVELAENSLSSALQFMRTHVECGLLAPAVVNLSGEREYLCKRYPSLFVLFLRGLSPRWLRRRFERRLACYEMRDINALAVHWDPPIISGCFMLLSSTLRKRICGFDPEFFLYFEDFDLSLRAANFARIAYVPSVRIVHSGGHAARKGWQHIWMFARSAITFFNRHGWKFY